MLLDGSPAWENPATKDKILYLSDDLYIPPKSTTEDLLKWYRTMYSGFSDTLCAQLKAVFPIDTTQRGSAIWS